MDHYEKTSIALKVTVVGLAISASMFALPFVALMTLVTLGADLLLIARKIMPHYFQEAKESQLEERRGFTLLTGIEIAATAGGMIMFAPMISSIDYTLFFSGHPIEIIGAILAVVAIAVVAIAVNHESPMFERNITLSEESLLNSDGSADSAEAPVYQEVHNPNAQDTNRCSSAEELAESVVPQSLTMGAAAMEAFGHGEVIAYRHDNDADFDLATPKVKF